MFLEIMKPLRIGLGCVVWVLGASGVALAAPPPKPQGRVSDFARVMDSTAVKRTEAMLTELEQKTGAEVAVVTVPSVPDRDIEKAAVDLFQQWGIGKKGKDNGVLILCAVQDRKIRIEVGYGLEEILPDAKAGRIIDEQMRPYFRKGDFSAGLFMGAQAVSMVIAQHAGVTLTGANFQEAGPGGGSQGFSPEEILFLILVMGVFLTLLFIRRRGFRGGYGIGAGGFSGGFGGSFGGFGGGLSGGGGASGSW